MAAPNSYKDPYWINLAGLTEKKLKLPMGVLGSIVLNGEKSNHDAVSEAGAKTVFQIIPETRDAALKKYGIDAYLSPQNAAEVAGLLLKDSLARNDGNVADAVGEYHGGIDRKNWGGKTKAYIQRVMDGLPSFEKPKAGGEESQKLDALGQGFGEWLKANPASVPLPQTAPQQGAKPEAGDDPLAVGFSQWLKGQDGQSLADQIPGVGKAVAPSAEPGLTDKALGVLETGATLATGIPAQAAGAVELGQALIDKATGRTPNATQGDIENRVADTIDKFTYAPRTETGQKAVAFIGENAPALMGVVPQIEAGTALAKPAIVQAVSEGRKAPLTVVENVRNLAPGGAAAETSGVSVGTPTGGARFGSVGAAAADPAKVARATVANASKELQAEVERGIKKGEPINQKALENHVEAESLDHPVRLTAATATEDPILISEEKNSRGKNPEYIARQQDNNKALIDNLTTIRDRAAPDVFVQTPIEHGEALITNYQNLDNALRSDIKAKYKALEDANGGKFPIDAKAFAQEAFANLEKLNRSDFLPGKILSRLNRYAEGAEMDFNAFEQLRTILASEDRKAGRKGDGNKAMAISAVRQALEDLPLSESAAQVKELADAARSAARSRFAMLESDPAFKAVVDDKASADSFVNKHVVLSDTEQLQTMLKHLANDEAAKQTVASALINHLRRNARINEESGSFAQAGYNRALDKVAPKLEAVFGAEDAKKLQTVGRMAQLLDQQPKGSFVNNSNTAVSMATNELMRNIPGVKIAKAAYDKVKERKDVAHSLRPGAGIFAKEAKTAEVRRKVQEAAAKKAAKKQKSK